LKLEILSYPTSVAWITPPTSLPNLWPPLFSPTSAFFSVSTPPFEEEHYVFFLFWFFFFLFGFLWFHFSFLVSYGSILVSFVFVFTSRYRSGGVSK